MQIILDELIVADMIGAIGCVIHVGKYLKIDKDESTNIMQQNISYILKFMQEQKLKTNLILETASGQGTELFPSINNSILPLTNFYNRFTDLQKKYFKLCIDTCHIFVAGYDVRTKKNVLKLFDDLKEQNVLQHIALIHFNDSAKDFGTRVDRHEAIGHGFIGVIGLCNVLKQANKYKIPCVLETPDDSYITEIPWIKLHAIK